MNKKFKKIFIIPTSIIIFLVLSFIFYIAETQTGNQIMMNSPFDAFWHSVSSFFAIDYSSIDNLSIWGRILYIVFILLGIIFLGIIIGKIANIFTQQFKKRKFGYMGTNFKDHIIIIGWDSLSEEVAVQLINADKKIAIMTNRKDDIDIIYQNFSHKEVFVCFSDINKYSALDMLSAKDAKVIFLNNGNDSDKLISILNIRKEYPKIEFVVLLENSDLKDTFVSAGVTYIISKNEIAARMLASYIFEPAVANFTSDLMTSASHDEESDFDIQQYRVCEDNPYLKSDYGKMFYDLKQKYNIISIGLNKTNSKGLLKAPSDSEPIELGDDVIVIANGETEITMQDIFGVCEGI